MGDHTHPDLLLGYNVRTFVFHREITTRAEHREREREGGREREREREGGRGREGGREGGREREGERWGALEP